MITLAIPQYTIRTTNVEVAQHPLAKRDAILKKLRYKLFKAQQQMKASTDKKRREAEFAIGYWLLGVCQAQTILPVLFLSDCQPQTG